MRLKTMRTNSNAGNYSATKRIPFNNTCIQMTPVQSPSHYTIHINKAHTVNIITAPQSPPNAEPARPVIVPSIPRNLDIAAARNVHSPMARRPVSNDTEIDSPPGSYCCCAWTWRSKKANTGNLQPAGSGPGTNCRVSSTVVSRQQDSEALPDNARPSVRIQEDAIAVRQLFTRGAEDEATSFLHAVAHPGSPHHMQNEAQFLIDVAAYEGGATTEEFSRITNTYLRPIPPKSSKTPQSPQSPNPVNVSAKSYNKVLEHEQAIEQAIIRNVGVALDGTEFAAPRTSVEQLFKTNIRTNSRLREDFRNIRKNSMSESTRIA
jgi:hypothetical protein